MTSSRFAGFALSTLLLLTTPAYAAENITEKNIEDVLTKVFKTNPELVMNVLRANSEAVLDIAQDGSTQKRKRALEAQWLQDMQQPKKVALDNRPIFGAPDAPVTVIEFSDFTCAYCAQAATTLKKIMAMYKGKVNVVFKHTPLSTSPYAMMASRYVVAAGMQSAEKALRLYETYFANQGRLMTEGETYLKEAAKDVGIDMRLLARDMRNARVQHTIEEDLKDAKELGVEGTPYFLVNDLVVRGSLPFELFKVAVDTALQKAQ